jgi:hypothetical protein
MLTQTLCKNDVKLTNNFKYTSRMRENFPKNRLKARYTYSLIVCLATQVA